jgi:hypothetical protein
MGLSLQMGFEKKFHQTFSDHPIPRVRWLRRRLVCHRPFQYILNAELCLEVTEISLNFTAGLVFDLKKGCEMEFRIYRTFGLENGS